MLLRVITLPFDPVLEGFPDEIVTEFCLNKKIHRLDSQFFIADGKAFWTVCLVYEILKKGEDKTLDLDEYQKLLYERLREWRQERARQDKIPVYLIATNQHLIEMVRRKTQTMEALKPIRGFGRSRVEKYGKSLINVIKAFYEEKKPKNEDNAQNPPF
ncbi:MAG: HRDC domain-containing protein [Saprospiraceae bacterium]|nr:HRDC domain-containing protein [Saprospiraceae bacterium]